jgi:uncharacterized protein (TIGR02145 family)
MKQILIVTLTVLMNFVGHSQINKLNQFTDSRDNKSYTTIKIGNQTWMAENLAYKPSSGNFFIYNNDQINLSKYGYLYDWKTACSVCPSGWRLPSQSDFLELTNYLGVDFKQKMMLNSAWGNDENAVNTSAFSGLPAGMRDHLGAFKYMGIGGYFWTSTFSHQSFAFAREIGKNAGNWASSEFGTNQFIGMSVRCLKDQLNSDDNSQNETLDDEYTEFEFQEPKKIAYSENYPIKKGVTIYNIYKTQTCNEEQDLYYEYTNKYKCEPMKMELFNLTIDIHLNDPMNNEAKIKLLNLKTKELTEFDIENVGQLEDGSLNFVFSIINQPHQFILNQTKKTITWFSEWGHWQTNYFYK